MITALLLLAALQPTLPPEGPEDSYMAVGTRHCPTVGKSLESEAFSSVEAGRRYRVSRRKAGAWAHKAIPYVNASPVDFPALGDAIVSERDCLAKAGR